MTTFILRVENGRERFKAAWAECCRYLEVEQPVRVTVEPMQCTRTAEQNAKMWAVLTDIAEQVKWPVDGELQLLAKEDWKHIITAGLKKEQRIAAGIGGGFVVLGERTSRMTIKRMSDVIEFALWFGAERGVRWSDEYAKAKAA